MSKKTKNIILIILGFLISLFIFELIFGIGNFDRMMEDAMERNLGGPFIIFTSFVLAGIYHAIFIGIIAIILRFTNIDKIYKKIIAYLPVYSLVLILPMMLVAGEFASFFHLYGLG